MRKFVSFLGTNNMRPPGADLPLDDRRRRSQHLGLRRDDEFVQRHAEHQVRDVHRLERCRSAPGVDAAHAARQGNRRAHDRRRPAFYAHRGEGRRIRPHPLGHRYPVPVRHAVSRLQERLGRHAIHPRSRLRHGQGQGRDHDQVDAGQGRGSLRRSRGAGLQDRRDDGEEQSRRPWSGAWARRSTRSATRSCAHRASCSSRWATSACPAAAPTFSAATTTCRARPTSARIRIRCPRYYGLATGSWKHWAAVWGVDYEWIKKQFASKAMMEKIGHDGVALDRRRAREERPHRPGFEPARDGVLGPCAEQPDARARKWSRR